MEAFLERYYRQVDRRLGDPDSSRRYPKSDKYEDLLDLDREVFDSLLKVFGQESMMGYAEAEIVLKNGVSFYPLPMGFRQFVQMENRTTNGRIGGIIRSKSFYDTKWGADVLTAERGFRIFPAPLLSGNQTWTLVYLRAPGALHYAKAREVGPKTITFGTPGEDAGEVFLVDDYYNGMGIRIFRAGNRAAPQEGDIVDFTVTNGTGVAHVRHPWNPMPSGDVWYELMPTLPLQYDLIYSYDAALLALTDRDRPDKVESLKRTRRKKWDSCIQYFASNVSDRGPTRVLPLKEIDLMTTGEVPY